MAHDGHKAKTGTKEILIHRNGTIFTFVWSIQLSVGLEGTNVGS